ncbi:MAG TPA: hypothetical protein VGK19_17315 [Capsulimonadaceae bacterium]
MYFFAASTNALCEAYALKDAVFSPPYYGDLQPNLPAFARLVETVFSYPHPMCLVWGLSAAQAYEGISGYEDMWEWPTEMMPYVMEQWYPNDAMPLRVPRRPDCASPTNGQRDVLHSFRMPSIESEPRLTERSAVAVTSNGRRLCEIGLMDARLFAAHAIRYGQMTSCEEPVIEFVGDELRLHPHHFLTLFERAIGDACAYSYVWLTMAVDFVHGIVGHTRDWYITNGALPLMPLQNSNMLVPLNGNGLVSDLNLVKEWGDSWTPTRFPDPRWEFQAPRT